MHLFENIVILMAVAIALLRLTRRFVVPYPTMLALAGVIVALTPWSPQVHIDPALALALFIAPALGEAAFDFSWRDLTRRWWPLVALAFFAVILSTVAVAWVGVTFGGLPLVAAVALGAIVAPPDAAAAVAVLGRFDLPESIVAVLKGESLLNDAVALLIFASAVALASNTVSIADAAPQIALAAPGGILLGMVAGRVYALIYPHIDGTLSGTMAGIVATFGVWLAAERLHLSPILAAVASTMVVAHYMRGLQTAHDRVLSQVVWSAVVFVLNVLAFLLIGLQAREIVVASSTEELVRALAFAGVVFAVIVAVRVVWVFAHAPRTSVKERLVIGWCGMRGLVTLATALALPANFPGRELVVFTAFVVTLGTLVVQGLTLGPLIRFLRVGEDASLDARVARARVSLIDAALDALEDDPTDGANFLRRRYRAEKAI